MVQRVGAFGLAGHFLVEELEVLGHGRRLVRRAVQTDEAGVEVAQVGLEHLGRVALGVQGDEDARSEEHTSELQSPCNLVCRLLLEKKKKTNIRPRAHSYAPALIRPTLTERA